MRVLCTLLPATGSLHALAPVAQALAQAGHEVALCSSRSFGPEAEATGFPYFETGLDWRNSDPRFMEILGREAGVQFPGLTGKARYAWVKEHLFIGAAARRNAPDVVAVARRWKPDIILRESLEFSGCAAAEALDIPHASVAAPADAALDQRGQLAEPLSRLRASLGLPDDAEAQMLYRYLHLCFTPPRWDGPEARVPDTAVFLRHTNPDRPGESLPTWLGELPDRPLVLVSLGTVFHRTPGLFEAIIEGLRDEPINLLVAGGRDQDPARFGMLPPHVRIERYLPQTLLLPRCTLFVTHGGFNSVKEALSLGVPMVVVPIAGDQPYSAERCEALGVAEIVVPDARTPDRVREAARAVLGEAAYRARAEEMRRDMAALPDTSRAVELLESLATSRQPVSGCLETSRRAVR